MTYQKVVKLSEQIIPKYYSTFQDGDYMHKIFTSGRAGTKSSRGGIKALYKILSDDDCSVVIMRKYHNKLKKTVYKEVLRAMTRLGLEKTDFKIMSSPMEIRYKNGNTIYFTGNDSIDDTKGMIDELKPIKLVIIDELTEFFEKGDGEDELVNIEATFVRGNSEAFCMEYYFNPPKNDNAPIMQWTRKMEQRSDTVHIHTDYRDVPEEWLGHALIESAEEMKRVDETMYNWLWLGQCTGSPETVYYMFTDDMISDRDNFRSFIHIGIAVDYGQLNATTFQAFGMNTDRLEVEGIKEYYHSGRESGIQKTPSDYAKEFRNFYNDIENITERKVEYVYIDPSARGLAEEIKRLMPGIRILGANNKVDLGISRVQKMFSFGKFYINKSQKNLINELYQYRYNKGLLDKGREEVIKANDHCVDAMRYYIMGMWRYISQALPYTERGE